MSTSHPMILDLDTVISFPSQVTSAPAILSMSTIALSPCGSSRSMPVTVTLPPRAPATSGNAAEEKSAGTM